MYGNISPIEFICIIIISCQINLLCTIDPRCMCKCYAIIMDRGISKSRTHLDRSGEMYNATPHFEARTLFSKMISKLLSLVTLV